MTLAPDPELDAELSHEAQLARFARYAPEYRQQRDRQQPLDRVRTRPLLDEPDKQRARMLPIYGYADMLAMPEPEWLIEGVLARRSSAVLFGKSNSFKSFLAVDMGACISTRRDWHGCAVLPGKVLYVATEGANGIGRVRLPGWYQHHNIREEDRHNLFLWPHEIALDKAADVEALIATIGPIAEAEPFEVLICDVFGATMAGHESEHETARAWVGGVQRLIAEAEVAVLTLAHTGWQDDTRARGHTHFWGSFDTRLKAEGDKDARTVTLSVDRHKDSDSTGAWGFQLVNATGPQGHRTLVPELDADVSTRAQKRVSGKPLIALQALDDALAEHGRRIASPELPSCPVVEIDRWRAECDRHHLTTTDTPEAKKKAFQRASATLQDRGVVRLLDGFAWRVIE